MHVIGYVLREKDTTEGSKVFPIGLDPLTPLPPGLHPAVWEDWDLLGEPSLEMFFPGLLVYVCVCVFV